MCYWSLRLPWQKTLVEPFYGIASLALTILSLVAAPLSWAFDWIMFSRLMPPLSIAELAVAVVGIIYFGAVGWGLAWLASERKRRWLVLAVLSVVALHTALLTTRSLRAAAGLAAQEAATSQPDADASKSTAGPTITQQAIEDSFFVVREVVSEPDDQHSAAVERQVETLYYDPDTALFTQQDVDPASIEIEGSEWPDGTETLLLSLRLLEEPAASWAQWSGDNVGARVGIFLDGELVQAPSIRSRMITGLMVIHLGWSRAKVERLAESLRQAASGRRPASAGFRPPKAAQPIHDAPTPYAPEEFRTPRRYLSWTGQSVELEG